MSVLSTFELALSFADHLLGKLPDYDQSKKETFYKTKAKYENEKKQPPRYRDDGRVDKYRDELQLFLQAFNSEISSKRV